MCIILLLDLLNNMAFRNYAIDMSGIINSNIFQLDEYVTLRRVVLCIKFTLNDVSGF